MYFLTLAHFSNYCERYFPTTQIIRDYGFTHIKSEAAIPTVLLNSFSENSDFWRVLLSHLSHVNHITIVTSYTLVKALKPWWYKFKLNIKLEFKSTYQKNVYY